MMLAFIYLNLKLHLQLRKLRPPWRFRPCVVHARLGPAPRSFFCPVGIAKMPNTKRMGKTTPGRDTHRGAPQRLRILESDSSSSSDEEDFVDHDRRSSTDTSRVSQTPPLQQQSTITQYVEVPLRHYLGVWSPLIGKGMEHITWFLHLVSPSNKFFTKIQHRNKKLITRKM